MKKPHFCWAFLLLIVTVKGHSRDLTHHKSYSQREKQVQVFNSSSEVQDLWLLIYQNEFIEEVHFEIPPKSKKTIPLQDYKLPEQDVAVLTKSDLLKINREWETTSSTSYERSGPLPQNLKIEVTNLGLSPQNLDITYFNRSGQKVKETNLELSTYMKTKDLTLSIPASVQKIRLRAPYPFHIPSSFHFRATADADRQFEAEAVHFVAEFEPGSQFTFALKDSDLIAKAREEIKNPSGLIVFGDVSLNDQSSNPNLAENHQPQWSWRLKNVTSLDYLGADWCQVYPEMLERMLSVILAQEQVCFRGSRIISEMKNSWHEKTPPAQGFLRREPKHP